MRKPRDFDLRYNIFAMVRGAKKDVASEILSDQLTGLAKAVSKQLHGSRAPKPAGSVATSADHPRSDDEGVQDFMIWDQKVARGITQWKQAPRDMCLELLNDHDPVRFPKRKISELIEADELHETAPGYIQSICMELANLDPVANIPKALRHQPMKCYKFVHGSIREQLGPKPQAAPSCYSGKSSGPQSQYILTRRKAAGDDDDDDEYGDDLLVRFNGKTKAIAKVAFKQLRTDLQRVFRIKNVSPDTYMRLYRVYKGEDCDIDTQQGLDKVRCDETMFTAIVHKGDMSESSIGSTASSHMRKTRSMDTPSHYHLRTSFSFKQKHVPHPKYVSVRYKL